MAGFQLFNSLCYFYVAVIKWLCSCGNSGKVCEIVSAIVRKLTLFSKSLHNTLNKDSRPLAKERSKYEIIADYLNHIGLVILIFICLNIKKNHLVLYA